jgi:hypothetical protein
MNKSSTLGCCFGKSSSAFCLNAALQRGDENGKKMWFGFKLSIAVVVAVISRAAG